MSRRWNLLVVLVLLGLTLAGCGVNNIPTQEEAAKAKWSQVLNQYQRRADLIPNLVETVKGVAKQESTIYIGVAEARSRLAASATGRGSAHLGDALGSFYTPAKTGIDNRGRRARCLIQAAGGLALFCPGCGCVPRQASGRASDIGFGHPFA